MKSRTLQLLIYLILSSNLKAQESDSLVFKEWLELAREQAYEEAKPLLLNAVQEGFEITTQQRGQAFYYLMQIHWNQSEHGQALQFGDTATMLFDIAQDPYWSGFTYYSMCMNNLILGSYDIALIQAQNAYDQFIIQKDTTMMIRSLTRRGIVFHDIGEYDQGIRVCDEAKELYDQFSEAPISLMEPILGIKAINYDDAGESAKAVELYRRILEFKDHLSDKTITRTYNNMGNSLMKIGQFDQAKKYFLLNLEANERKNFKYGIATVKTNLGTVAYKQRDYPAAAQYLDEAEKIAYEIKDAEKVLDVLQQQHLYLEVLGAHARSLSYLKEYHTVKDSLYDLDKQRQIRLLETTFETDKKERQIELQASLLAEKEADIRRKQTILIATILVIAFLILTGILLRNRLKKKQQIQLQAEKLKTQEAEINATISSQEKERARYARDLHDGFGQMISILNMNIKSLEHRAKPNERRRVFESSEKVIEDMYAELKNICFDLMPQTLVQNGLQSGLREFCDRVNTPGKVHLELNVFGLNKRLNELQEISLYRITQEWVNNILKYSEADKITVQITRDEAEITLLIEDNGVGFDKNLLSSKKGNGWRNLNTRANLISGKLELETTVGIIGNTLIVNVPSRVKISSEPTKNTMEAV